MWLELERTCEEIARFSRADERAYRRLLTEYDAVKDVFNRQRFTPVGFGPGFEELLAGRPGSDRWRRRAAMSAWEVVRHEFESRHVQAFMLWMAFQTGQPVGSAGSAPLAYSIVFGRQRRSWTLPRGGSGELARVLVEVIEQGGGQVLCDRRVAELILTDGRCVGVVTEDGERHIARKAVLSTIHVKDLVTMAPAEHGRGLPLRDRYLRRGDLGVRHPLRHDSGAPLSDARRRRDRGRVRGRSGWPEDILRMGRDVREGRLVRDGAWLLFPAPTVADPSRAPAGRHTVKILGMQPYNPGGGPWQWAQLRDEIAAVHLGHLRRAAPNMVDATILAELIVSPVDLERSNPHMWHGTFHGGDRSIANSGALRPAPGWAQHRMPIPGLYQTGGTTHPGGSVTGGPGRNAAIVMLTDLGQDPADVSGSRRQRPQLACKSTDHNGARADIRDDPGRRPPRRSPSRHRFARAQRADPRAGQRGDRGACAPRRRPARATAPTRSRRGLKTNRSYTIGVMIPDLTNPLFPPIVRGIEDQLGDAGYTPLIVNTDNDPGRERSQMDAMRARQVDGFIAATARLDIELLPSRRRGTPLVLVNRSLEDGSLAAVTVDDRQGIRLAVNHVVELGHRRIGHVAARRTCRRATCAIWGSSRRWPNSASAARPEQVVFAEAFTEADGRAGVRECWTGAAGDRVVAANDRLASAATTRSKPTACAAPTTSRSSASTTCRSSTGCARR